MSFLAPIAASAAGSLVTGGLSKLMGGGSSSGSSLSTFTPTGINAGGLASKINDAGNIQINPSAERTAAVTGVANTFGQQADALATLIPRVAPGISELRAARLGAIENARQSAVGNLRDNLARRRVLGSSFAQDAISRADSEFAQQSERAAAESFLQEMEMTTNLIQQQFSAQRGQFQTQLDEMNLEANLAATLAGKATDVLSKNAQVSALLDSKAQEGAGKFFGQLLQPVGNSVTKSLSSLFSGSSGSNAGGTGFSLTTTGGLY